MKILWTLILSCFLMIATCQNSIAKNELATFPVVSIGISPSALLSNLPGLQGSLDFRLDDAVALTSEFALHGMILENYNGYGYKCKLGIQFRTKTYEQSFTTIGVNYVRRDYELQREYSQGILTNRRTTIDRKEIANGLELTSAYHYFLSERIKVEIGAGIGVAQQFLTREKNGTSTLPINNSGQARGILIASFHFNIAYCLFTN